MIDLIGGSKSDGLNFGERTINALKTHKVMMGLHYQVIACHCECMGMMRENQMSPTDPIYIMKDFKDSMIKFGLLNKNGDVNI